MRESQFLLGIKREGMQEGELRARQLDLLELVRIRLADPVPEDVRRAVQGTTAVEVLSAWFRTAAVAASLAELRAVMRVGVPEAV